MDIEELYILLAGADDRDERMRLMDEMDEAERVRNWCEGMDALEQAAEEMRKRKTEADCK